MKRKWIALVALVLSVTMLVPLKTWAQEDVVIDDDQFGVTVTCGLDGMVRMGRTIPLDIMVENRGKDFSGTIRIFVPGSEDSKGIAYERDLNLAAQTNKTIHMAIPGTGVPSYLTVRILNEKGKVIDEADYKTNMINNQSDIAVVGILSDDYTALNYFDGAAFTMGYFNGTAKIIELTKDTVPDEVGGLDICDYIIINSFDTSVLTEGQYSVIKKWVAYGGVLMIGTGVEAQKVLNIFQDDFLSVKVGNHTKQVLELADENTNAAGVEADMTSLEVAGGYKLQGITTESHAWFKQVDRGGIAVFEYNLGMEPITSWDRDYRLAQSILGCAKTNHVVEKFENNGGGNINVYTVKGAIDSAEKTKAPNVIAFGLLFLLYCIAIGPGIYLVLKLKDRRQYMWVAIPVLSLATTILLFGISQLYCVRKPFMNKFSITEYSADGYGVSTVYASVESPKSKDYAMTMKEEYHGFTPLLETAYNSYASKDNGCYYIVNNRQEGIAMTITNHEVFQPVHFSVTKNEEKQGPVIGTDELICTMDSIKGTVTNHSEYDLEDVCIICGNAAINLGDIKAGDSALIDEKEVIDASSAYNYYYNVLRMLLSEYDGSAFKNWQEQITRAKIESAYDAALSISFQKELCESGEEGFIIAHKKESKNSLLQRGKITEYENGVLIQRFNPEIDWSQVERIFKFEEYANIVRTEGELNLGEGYMNGYESEFFVMLPSDFQLNRIYYTWEDGNKAPLQDIQVFAKNVSTEQYEQIFVDSNEMTIEQMKPYLDPGGAMMFKIAARDQEDDAGMWFDIPYFKAAGGVN